MIIREGKSKSDTHNEHIQLCFGNYRVFFHFFLSCGKIFVHLILNNCHYVNKSSAESLTGYHSFLLSSVTSLCP